METRDILLSDTRTITTGTRTMGTGIKITETATRIVAIITRTMLTTTRIVVTAFRTAMARIMGNKILGDITHPGKTTRVEMPEEQIRYDHFWGPFNKSILEF